MSIVVICPHCETRFTLQPEMNGKSMRCPNLECRQVFTVTPAPIRETAPPPQPKPGKSKTGAVGDMVPVLDAQLVSAPPGKREKGKKPGDKFQVIEAAVVAPPVKEVVWSADAEVPGGPPLPPAPRRSEPEPPSEIDLPVLRRRKKKKKGKNVRAWILIGGMVGILVVGFFAVREIFVVEGKTEEKFADEAKEAYAKADYAAAAKKYEELAAKHAGNDQYKFYADLSGMQSVVRSVTNKENPDPAIERLRTFVEANKSSPFAKPTVAGGDVFDAGKKVAEDVADHIDDRVKAFRADRKKLDELARAEKMIATGRELLPVIDGFRTDKDAPLDPIRGKYDAAENAIKVERNRLAVLERVGKMLENPTDRVIEQAGAQLAENNLQSDPEGEALVKTAREKLRSLVRYEVLPNGPRKPAESSAASLLFVAPIGATKTAVKAPTADDPGPTVFLAVARGVLYALDEDSGDLLWAARVGPDVFDPPAIAKVDFGEGPTELAVVTSNVAGQAGLTAYVLRTGQPRWFQPLEQPAAGPAVVHGTRAFVPIRDDLGSVFEFDLAKGDQIGKISLSQPIGPAAMRPGTGLLYVPADARRVYVIDVGGKNEDGVPTHPRCVQVLLTSHLAGTLRTPPMILGPSGDEPANRWLVLCQADGPTTMKMRTFPLVGATTPADGGVPPEVVPESTAELPVPGWAWFPPVTDGERLAVVTDTGHLRLFGVNQPGNNDRPIFPLPNPPATATGDGTPVPGFVVPAEEAAFWVLAGGSLQKVRLSLVPARGLEAVAVARPAALGVPTQPAQLNKRRDAACFVVRSATGSGFRAVTVNLRDGDVRWQRQLGVVPAAPPIPHGGGLLLIDEDGGVALVPPTVGAVAIGATKVAEPGWVLASALDGVTGRTLVALSQDATVVHTVTPVVDAGAAKYVIRKIVDGKIERVGTVNSPGPLVGPPVAFEQGLLLPAADGFVHRVVPGDGRLRPDTLAPGPRWWEDRRNPDAVCFITVLSDDTFLTSDGGKVLTRWRWPAVGNWMPGNATWEVRERVAVPPVVLPPAGGGGARRLVVADVTGSVWMYSAEQGGQPARRWRPGGAIPVGRPTAPMTTQTDANGRIVLSYVVDGRTAVCLDPEKDVPLWVAKSGESLVGSAQPIGDERWLIADLNGHVEAIDGRTGQPAAKGDLKLPGVVPAAAGAKVEATRMLVPLSDGSAVVVPLGDGGK